MASDGKEEREFKIKLRDEILNIGALGDWIQPPYLVVEESLEKAMEHKFPLLQISITDVVTMDDPHKFGVSGQLTFLCLINIVIRNLERAEEPLPAKLVGISDAPSLSDVDGVIRNGLFNSTLGGWCFVTDLGNGMPIDSEEIPEGCIGRQYSFSAVKEVAR